MFSVHADQPQEIAMQGACRASILALAGASRIEVRDVARLRAELADSAGVGAAEADALFALERSTPDACPEWTAFFVEAITDFVVWQARPTGVVNTAQAEWLIAQADETCTLNAFATLVNVLAEAHRVPAWLPAAVRGRGAKWPCVAAALNTPTTAAA
jgi:hypothetical protein